MSNERSGDGISELSWFKSSHSSSEGGACVEVAAPPGAVHVRDSKHHTGPRLSFDPSAWTTFLAHTRTDRPDA